MFLKINNPPLVNLENTFIHRNAWFNICNFTYSGKDDQWSAPLDQTSPAKAEDVKDGDVIYLTPWGVEKFLTDIHPHIQARYSIVSYCYGPVLNVTDKVLDDKIIAWYGAPNVDAITFEKFTLIPLGVLATNEVFNQRVHMNNEFSRLRTIVKSKLLHMNFKVHQGEHCTLAGRPRVFDMFKDKSYCTTVYLTHEWRKSFSDYMNELAEHKFTLAPFGDLYDTYRLWEALIVGVIPIIHTSPLDKIFEDLPVVIVNDYAEINEQFLNLKYEELKNKTYNLDKLYMKYWEEKIGAK